MSSNLALMHINCKSNKLLSLVLPPTSSLDVVICDSNQITTLIISKNPGLERLSCKVNKLSSKDLSNSPLLTFLDCENNLLSTLDVSHLPVLELIHCSSNKLSSMDITKNPALSILTFLENPGITEMCYTKAQVNSQPVWEAYHAKNNIRWTLCSGLTLIQDENNNGDKILLRIVTLLGQEVDRQHAEDGLFIYQFTDGKAVRILK